MASHSHPRPPNLEGRPRRRRTSARTPAQGPETGALAVRAAALAARASRPEDLTRAFLHEASSTLGGKAWLVLPEPEGGVAWFPPGQVEPFPARLASQPDSLIAQALAAGREALVIDGKTPGEFPERRFLRRSEAAQWVFLPVVAAGETVACLVARGPRGGEIPRDGLAQLREALPVLGLSLRVGLMHQEMEARVVERTHEITLLYEVSRAMGFLQRTEDLPPLLARSLRRALPIDLLCVTLPWADRSHAWLVPMTPTQVGAARLLCRKSLAECRRLTGRAPGKVVITVMGKPSTAASALAPGDLRSVAHAPLSARGETFGTLTVASRQRGQLDGGQARLLLTCAAQAALCLDRLQAAREAETGRLRSMVDSMAEGVVLLDRSLRVLMANPAARAHVAMLSGSPFGERLARLGEVRLRAVMAQLSSPDSPPYSFEVSTQANDKLFSVTCSPVAQGGGPPDGLVMVISDITAARQLQVQAAQHERLSALGEMISGVAHELNNPLASVMSHAQLLGSRELPGDAPRKLNLINREAARCQRIVNVLLRFARPQAPERRALLLNDIADSVAQLLGFQAGSGDVSLELELDPDLPLVIGDEHLLQQVVMNIAQNALQALRQKGEGGSIKFATRAADGLVQLEITDDGPGISPEHLPRLFDPFFSTKEVGKGTGLGLSIAFATVRDHGGTITARSRQGEGAAFLVSLPAGPAAAAARRSEPAAPEKETAPEPAAGLPAKAADATGRRILVVDDEQALAEVMAEVLASYGHHVDTKFDGRSAREAAMGGDYDAIITDLKMPGLNGREFYKQVVSARPDLARRIIFSTGDTASPVTQAFFEEVGNPVLNKPFNLQDMVRLVDEVLAAG